MTTTSSTTTIVMGTDDVEEMVGHHHHHAHSLSTSTPSLVHCFYAHSTLIRQAEEDDSKTTELTSQLSIQVVISVRGENNAITHHTAVFTMLVALDSRKLKFAHSLCNKRRGQTVLLSESVSVSAHHSHSLSCSCTLRPYQFDPQQIQREGHIKIVEFKENEASAVRELVLLERHAVYECCITVSAFECECSCVSLSLVNIQLQHDIITTDNSCFIECLHHWPKINEQQQEQINQKQFTYRIHKQYKHREKHNDKQRGKRNKRKKQGAAQTKTESGLSASPVSDAAALPFSSSASSPSSPPCCACWRKSFCNQTRCLCHAEQRWCQNCPSEFCENKDWSRDTRRKTPHSHRHEEETNTNTARALEAAMGNADKQQSMAGSTA